MLSSSARLAVVAFIESIMDRTPAPLRGLVMQHHELIKFAIVGATTCVFDLAIFYSLVFTVLDEKPTVAKIFSGVCAVILSYILNREWSFKNRGGRERHHEALLFFVISGIGVLIMAAPIFIANNVFNLRATDSKTTLIVVDFVLNYIVGNLLQMAFRFWALRRWAFPEDMSDAPEQESIPAEATDPERDAAAER
ncbi:GtrA family protein OS=Tsukamurella paurometabola (strain ATCC 8368 / DSM / CCUG 35730 / CIP 100753 / JCM 10117 / KCTC 9821 / NBRC 16120 / NCIMB 702349/ NCTC 13040) OX=521096 GN=Tpau_1048 PE=3 SV=1 [Tsukamurella paurometabola]|uniref:GtrA family protein n=1 Tax=Tsukamurella paurometabola (strain ATCC 8368 / DSM 20162 / CCUG 35730 / CIP 100753 / JCM 10117 / KCTC 9821 / NBRC 16120 / NCIMB 702349 / NCTC 13040) TaxID=521096 RepID=D5UV91_TSUPD|nr:GtrA family protein [Tsukamurella paurometabola DSM 20162]SUP28271.1 GtrA-like protein [Tsukamurella paurometabola]